MKVFFNILSMPVYKNPALALGVFDGVHRGHRVVLKEAVRRANAISGTSMVLTFWPHPQEKENLYSLEHRLRLICEMGIAVSVVIKFNRAFSNITAEEFVKNILIKKIGARYIYIGKNFRFGKNAQGDYKLLKKLSRQYNFKLKAFDLIKAGNKPISSTYIRKLITSGELEKAERLLCKPVSILGVVIPGDALGRRLGFPTANINPCHEIIPPDGIYAAKIIFTGKIMRGLCYIGSKPTFRKNNLSPLVKKDKYVEVYIFDFHKNIYGERLEIQFLKKIRDDQRFSSAGLLIKQIKKDIVLAKKIFFLH